MSFQRVKDVAARLVNAIAAVVGIILLVIIAFALVLVFVNSCIDPPDPGDDVGSLIQTSA